MRNTIAKLALAAIAIALTPACSEEEETAVAVTPTKKDTEAVAEKVEVEKKSPDQDYKYDVIVGGVARRDPFLTYIEAVEPSTTTTPGVALTPLQQVDLDKLKLVAVIVGTATPMAMVEEPGGKGYTVKIGTLIGRRLGQVKHIRRGELIVQEEFRDFTGKRIPQLKELRLATDEPAGGP
jgi:type IV pilus assembly protein PilP